MQPSSRPLALLACLLAAACDDPKPASNASTTASATAPAAASATAPAASTEPAPALPSSDPTSMHSAAPPMPSASVKPDASASAKPQASAKAAPKPTATAAAASDAGASDAGASAAIDAGAAPSSPALDLARKVDAIFGAKQTFSARFKQQYTLKATGVVKDSSGTVMMERPSKISFRYDPPNKSRIVSDGTTIKVYTAEDNQMIEMPAQKTQYPGALAFMMGNGISSSFQFAINQKAQWSGGVILDGKPLTPNPSYETVMFYIDTALLPGSDPNAMKRVLVLDAQGNKNRFDFENITQPPSIPPSEFVFTPPPGTEIKK